jgi:hypothetical protein
MQMAMAVHAPAGFCRPHSLLSFGAWQVPSTHKRPASQAPSGCAAQQRTVLTTGAQTPLTQSCAQVELHGLASGQKPLGLSGAQGASGPASGTQAPAEQ